MDSSMTRTRSTLGSRVGRSLCLALATLGPGVVSGAWAVPSASFANGVLTIIGDDQPETIVVSRDDELILVNGVPPLRRRRALDCDGPSDACVAMMRETATVANTVLIRIFGNGGNDVISIVESGGPPPPLEMDGGEGNDTLHGGLSPGP